MVSGQSLRLLYGLNEIIPARCLVGYLAPRWCQNSVSCCHHFTRKTLPRLPQDTAQAFWASMICQGHPSSHPTIPSQQATLHSSSVPSLPGPLRIPILQLRELTEIISNLFKVTANTWQCICTPLSKF